MFKDPTTFLDTVNKLLPDDSPVGIKSPEKLTFLYISAPWCEKDTKMGEIVQKVAKSFDNSEFIAYDYDAIPAEAMAERLQEKLPFMGIPHLLVFTPNNKFSAINGTRTEKELLEFVNTNLV